MWKRNLYYRLKPYLPWRVRNAFRRVLARRARRASAAVWPVNPAAARRPHGWRGWPEGKDFAVVLTHDVEGASGVAKCRQLMDLEAALGFRSSFNFIPEGEYRVSTELRSEAVRRGFEVGVHDRHHDGKLYLSREVFREHARVINRYLRDWNAVGFRSGFMHHNLDWIQDLDVLYDASTFDTDPFEPQPDAANTIFPFHVTGTEGRKGYVELPYTLVQDSTLFLILREKDDAVWRQKTDWLVEQGGMVLLNLHPDYVHFGSGRPPVATFPARHYAEFLTYLNARYASRFWAPLPRDLAAWFAREHRPAPGRIPAAPAVALH